MISPRLVILLPRLEVAMVYHAFTQKCFPLLNHEVLLILESLNMVVAHLEF